MSGRKPIRSGEVFGDYTVVSDTPQSNARNVLKYLCRCVCGTEKYVNAYSLRNGRSAGCGCRRNRETGVRSATHGRSKSAEYAVWLQARSRCLDPTHKQYADYGGRGITMCKRWQRSFNNFIADMGEPPFPKATLERRNNNKGYSPANCKWATRAEQSRNKRNTRKFKFKGRSMILADWALELGVKKETLVSRIYLYKWSVEKTLTTPVK